MRWWPWWRGRAVAAQTRRELAIVNAEVADARRQVAAARHRVAEAELGLAATRDLGVEVSEVAQRLREIRHRNNFGPMIEQALRGQR